MWKFDFPWMFLLLPIPLIVWWSVPAWRTTTSAIRMPFFHEMAQAAGEEPAPGGVRLRRNILQRLTMPLLWVLLVTAAAKPVFVEPPVTHDEPARDLMLAIDLSESMSTRDFVNAVTGERMDRLTAVKSVVRDFVAKRKGDRIGVVVFGEAAYPQAPLTLDHDSVLLLLNQMQIGMAGPRTAIGDAIGLTVKLMDKSQAQEKMLILLTDGNDTSSAIPPERAADIAKNHKLVIHTIGIGDPSATGEDKVDLDALKRIADITGGQSFHALGNPQELADVYTTLDRMTPEKVKRETYRPQRDFFWIPLAVALLLLTLYHCLALLLAVLRAPRHEQVKGAAHGN
ncbi:von Willebrand factor type A domain protein [Caballeronia sordidicola]|uniref:von Willebrand factor type A domain protein n=1 Tax=Caballeronia sordidicola TaxID=196367 RepID=A0A158HJ71_CABSO|nr:VWA domain-containing protein [Caballeronia sordidicola]SAL43680.1 von Willebrand factor type A domain protein [Caballeronia sordidicola]